MKSDFTLFLVLAISLLGGVQSAAKDKPAADNWTETLTVQAEQFVSTGRNNYLILEPGHQLILEGKDGGRKAALIITVLDETKQVGDVETRVVEEREVVGGRLAEVSRNFFGIGVDTKHVYYFGEDVDIYKRDGTVVHEGAWLAGVDGARHGVLMPGHIRVRDRYYQEQAPKVAMDRAENVSTNAVVKTPAGTFAHCLKTKETTPLEPGTEYKFYAPGVGLVRDGNLKLVKHGFVK